MGIARSSQSLRGRANGGKPGTSISFCFAETRVELYCPLVTVSLRCIWGRLPLGLLALGESVTDPRTSVDPDLRAALHAWDSASSAWDESFDDSMRIHAALRSSKSHQAFGWAALTGGRIAAYRGDVDLAEVLLAEALGRLYVAGDAYGEQLAVSHLAIPNVQRRNLDRALELALRPLSSNIPFTDYDRSLLHNDAAMCYWAREETHDAISHLVKEFNLVKGLGNLERSAAVLGNIGAVLDVLGEWELSLTVSKKAWQLQLAASTDGTKLQLSQLSTIMYMHCNLGHYKEALVRAEELLDYLSNRDNEVRWMTYLNLVYAFSLNGLADRASACLERARASTAETQDDYLDARLGLGEAMVMFARRNFEQAIGMAMRVLEIPVGLAKREAHLQATMLVARAHAALGHTAETIKWKRITDELRHQEGLGDILSTQIRTNLSITESLEPLTEREQACLTLAARGQTSADIAMKLGITTRTANFHFSKILRKLNAANRQEAIAKAIGANLL